MERGIWNGGCPSNFCTNMRGASGHDRGKPSHYYTTEHLRRLVYSTNMTGASPLTTIRRSTFAGSCIVVRPLAGLMSLDLVCKNLTLTLEWLRCYQSMDAHDILLRKVHASSL